MYQKIATISCFCVSCSTVFDIVPLSKEMTFPKANIVNCQICGEPAYGLVEVVFPPQREE